MSRFSISVSVLILLFHCIVGAQDSSLTVDTAAGDSSAAAVTVSDTTLRDSTADEKDSLYPVEDDTLPSDTARADTVEAAAQSESGADTARKDSVTAPEPNDPEHGRAREVTGRKTTRAITAVKSILRKTIQFFARYFLPVFFLLISCTIIIYTIMFFHKKSDAKRFLTSTRLSVMDKQVRIACKYMEKHFDDPGLSVEKICEEMVTGPAFLEALFERELGMSVTDFLTHIRINRVKEVLDKEPDITVDELILRVGYTDGTLFHRHFKEINDIEFTAFLKSVRTE